MLASTQIAQICWLIFADRPANVAAEQTVALETLAGRPGIVPEPDMSAIIERAGALRRPPQRIDECLIHRTHQIDSS